MSTAGFIAGWRENRVVIQFARDFSPAIGDFYYVNQGARKAILQLTSLNSWMEAVVPAIEALHSSALISDSYTQTGLAEPFLEYNEDEGVLYASSSLPRPGSPVFKVDPLDATSSSIMSKIGEAVSEGVPACYLRAGLATHVKLRDRTYFLSSKIRLPIDKMIPKHILVSGQTGAGKTSGVKGIVVSATAYSDRPISWVVLDRHGEYSGLTGGVDFKRSLEVVSTWKNVVVDTIVLDYTAGNTALGVRRTPISLADIEVDDITTAMNLGEDDSAQLEELLEALSIVVLEACRGSLLSSSLCQHLVTQTGDEIIPKGHLFSLYLLLFDNAIRAEAAMKVETGVKYGFHEYLLDKGFQSIQVLRKMKREITETLNIRTRPKVYVDAKGSRRYVHVVDDSSSVFKTVEPLKEPESVVAILYVLLEALTRLKGSKAPPNTGPYKFIPSGLDSRMREELIAKASQIPVTHDPGMSLTDLASHLDDGRLFVVDLSRITTREGDVVALALARRILEERMRKGPAAAATLPPVALVSEEAPLYLSSEKVKSVYNPFARIAREGRKFNIGIVAITQMATMMDRQILSNFNTIIAMRTSHEPDLEFFKSIGIPKETLPLLGEREAYLYSVDIPIRRPLPVYLPGDFEEDLIFSSRREAARPVLDEKVYKMLAEEEES
ncbi:ATP-binding protein [Thermogladius sp.]|uniref:ATP-binding protein n=1 Tax=Thermogladius sp. TaxID=2023064 RepID=UPI003D12EA15